MRPTWERPADNVLQESPQKTAGEVPRGYLVILTFAGVTDSRRKGDRALYLPNLCRASRELPNEVPLNFIAGPGLVADRNRSLGGYLDFRFNDVLVPIPFRG